jgi:hypothetical protein
MTECKFIHESQPPKIEKLKEAQKLPEEFTPGQAQELEGNSKIIKPDNEEDQIIEFQYDIFQIMSVPFFR